MTADEIVKQLKPLGTETYQEDSAQPRRAGAVLRRQDRRPEEDPKADQEGLPARARSLRHRHLRRHVPGRADRRRCQDDQEGPAPLAQAGDLRRALRIHGPLGCGRKPAWCELALEWIESEDEDVALAGWATLSSLVSIKDDADLDLAELKRLLARVQKTIHKQPNYVRYVMNGFVIAVGSYVEELTDAGTPDRREDRHGHGGHGQHRLQSPLRPGVHPESAETRDDRQETQVGEMLIARPNPVAARPWPVL